MRDDVRLTRRDALLAAGLTCGLGAIGRETLAASEAEKIPTPLLDMLDGLPDAERTPRIMKLIREDREAFFRELRCARPIYETNDLVLLSRYPDVVEALSHPSVLTVELYAPKMGTFMLAQDETTVNWRDKGIMQGMINPDDAQRVREIVKAACAKALAGVAGAEPFDVVRHYTRAVPLAVVNEYFGFVNPDATAMLRWSRDSQYDNFHNHPFHGLADAAEIHARAEAAQGEMATYVAALIPQLAAELGQHPDRDDVLSRMLKCRFPASLGFDGARMVINTIGMLIGSIETTHQAVVHIVDQLLDRDRELAAMRKAIAEGDLATMKNLSLEALRFNPISPFMYRLAAGSHTLAAGTDREHLVTEGKTVLALTLSAMFDETVVENPEEFAGNGRPDSHYFHFGLGHHRCLGEHVGKIMIPEMVAGLLARPNVKRAAGDAGRIDYAGSPFPESFSLVFA